MEKIKPIKLIKTEIIVEYNDSDRFFETLNSATDRMQNKGYQIQDIKYSHSIMRNDETDEKEDVEVYTALIIFEVDNLDAVW